MEDLPQKKIVNPVAAETADFEKQKPIIEDYHLDDLNDSSLEQTEKGQHELLAEAMGKLVNKVKEGSYDSVVFLDKSARPLSTLMRDMWPHNFDADGHLKDLNPDETKMPNVQFLNVGKESSTMFEDIFKNHSKELMKLAQKRREELDAKMRTPKYETSRRKIKEELDDLEFIRDSKRRPEWRNMTDDQRKELDKKIEKLKTEHAPYKKDSEDFYDLEKISEGSEKYYGPGYVGDTAYSMMLKLMSDDAIIKGLGPELTRIADTYAMFEDGGKILIVDEYSNTGESREIAKRIIEAAFRMKNPGKTIEVEFQSLSGQKDALFRKKDAENYSPQWRSSRGNEVGKGITGVIEPEQGKLTADPYYKDLSAEELKKRQENVAQLRDELHKIASNYIENQRKIIADKIKQDRTEADKARIEQIKEDLDRLSEAA